MPSDVTSVDLGRVPVHVAIVMDGNGRWANARGLPRTAGHAAGEHSLFDVVEGALELGIQWLTVYTFSTENWTRDAAEVEYLMGFNESLLLRRRDEVNDLGVRVHFIGLGDDERPRTVRVRFPDGTVEEWRDVPPRRYTTLHQGTGHTPD